MSRWTPTTERLPDADLTVLIALDPAHHDEPVWLGYLDADGWRDVGGVPVFVTAWQDLPEPPQADGAALPQGEPSGETIEQREEVCEAWHALPDELRRDPRLTPLYRALGGPRMDDPADAERAPCAPGKHCARYAQGLRGCVAGHCTPPRADSVACDVKRLESGPLEDCHGVIAGGVRRIESGPLEDCHGVIAGAVETVDSRFSDAHFQDGRDLIVQADSHAPPVGVPSGVAAAPAPQSERIPCARCTSEIWCEMHGCKRPAGVPPVQGGSNG